MYQSEQSGLSNVSRDASSGADDDQFESNDPMISESSHSRPVVYRSGLTTSMECQGDSSHYASSGGRVLSVSTEGLALVVCQHLWKS